MAATQSFLNLVKLYRETPIEFSELKSVTLAMWILESGRGSSDLAKLHNNFAGMKWRTEMRPYATRILYAAHDGTSYYCKFANQENFIKGFWAFLERSPYNGWRDHTSDSEDFISFIGPTWAANPSYVERVLDLLAEADELLGAGQGTAIDHGTHAPGNACEACGHGDEVSRAKPTVDRWEPTSHQSSRNGTDIDHVVIHYTTSRNIEGTISHFKHGTPRTSAHYVVGRDGALVQMVNDSDRAWHAGDSDMNARSIGIEHVAAPGDKITDEQEKTSASLIAWLMAEYDVAKADVIPHVCVKPTSCCGDLFKDFGGGAGELCDVQSTALHAWMTHMGIG